MSCPRGHSAEDVLDEGEDRNLNGCTITTGCDLDRMSGGNKKVNITVTEYDLGNKRLEALLLWQSCNIDHLLQYQLALPSLSEL